MGPCSLGTAFRASHKDVEVGDHTCLTQHCFVMECQNLAGEEQTNLTSHIGCTGFHSSPLEVGEEPTHSCPYCFTEHHSHPLGWGFGYSFHMNYRHS